MADDKDITRRTVLAAAGAVGLGALAAEANAAQEQEKAGGGVGHLHDPEYLKALAERLRVEASRADARAERVRTGVEAAGCAPGCWNILSSCIFIQPL